MEATFQCEPLLQKHSTITSSQPENHLKHQDSVVFNRSVTPHSVTSEQQSSQPEESAKSTTNALGSRLSILDHSVKKELAVSPNAQALHVQDKKKGQLESNLKLAKQAVTEVRQQYTCSANAFASNSPFYRGPDGEKKFEIGRAHV